MMFSSAAVSKMAALERSQAFIGFRPDRTIITATALVMRTLASGLKNIVRKHPVKFPTSTGRRSDATWHFRDELRAGRSHVAAFREIQCVRAASSGLA